MNGSREAQKSFVISSQEAPESVESLRRSSIVISPQKKTASQKSPFEKDPLLLRKAQQLHPVVQLRAALS